MIIKMEKVSFTTNDLINGNGRGSLTAHVLYLVRNKNTKKYSKVRSDLFFKINPALADLGKKLKYDGENMSEAELENTVREYCQQQHDYVVNKYVNHSRKRKLLDEHNECLNTKGEDSLYSLKGNCTLEMDEYERILKYANGDKEKAKQILDEINNDFLAMYINEVKKQRGIKGRKTTINDIEKMSNFHIENEENPHIHFFVHGSFDPATKRWINPMAFAYTKQKIHMALEKKYSQFLNQGVAIGYYKNEGKIALKNYLAESINNGRNWKETRKNFKDIKNEINKAITSNKPTAQVISELKSKGIYLTPKGKDAKGKYKMNINIKGSDIELNTASFSAKNNKAFDINIKKFMERVEFDNLTKSNKLDENTDKIQSVLEDALVRTKKKLERDLRASEPSKHKKIKQKAFKEFTIRAKHAGLIVNLNKQGHLSFHKIDENNYKNKDGVENNVKARKYKSSLFVNPDLQGKFFIDIFELDEEEIFIHQTELFQLMPKTANYRDVVYFNTDLQEMNLVEKEFRIQQQYRNTLERFNLEVKFDPIGDFFLLDKQGRALVSQKYNDDNSSSITINNLHPKLASPVLLSMFQEDARALPEDKKLVITPDKNQNNFDTLRHLEVELMFSTDANSKKIEINYPNKITDEKLQKMIEQKLDKELDRFENNVQKFSKNKTKYTFTEASGIHLLQNPNFIDFHDKIKDQFNRQIIEMIAELGITEIKFSNKDDSFFDTNEKELLELARELPEDKKELVLKVIQDNKSKSVKTGIDNTKKSKNKIRARGQRI